MSKKKNKRGKKMRDCCCKPCCTPCCGNNVDGYGGSGGLLDGGFLGGGCGLAPIIFLLIACGSGLLNCNSSFLIILLFILFGGCFLNAGNRTSGNVCCC
ncbi:hypothetical protein [uncultured Clostridium sp.]|uniref:hypothetical protein n=1 Tax=uncultured Clostridium sp. TaxID=59620 RepID=UPI0028E9D883|nr:hypothetical protein [uncultured Clostridium sp.]